MVLIKIFGLLDLYSAIVMLLVQWGVVEWRMILTASAWLILKGWMFKGDLPSMIDLGIGVYHLLMFFAPIGIITYLLAAYLAIKGIQSVALS